APGAFSILACLTAIQNVAKEKGAKAGKDVSKIQSGCSSDCMNCSDSGCAKRLIPVEEEVETVKENKPEEKVENAETAEVNENKEKEEN
ncbi:MAG: hypothetical protein IKY53_00925, partial [Lachnospiraceae bacterium]|nr:hypothetical protein [Lachnospiraceae bacterium]